MRKWSELKKTRKKGRRAGVLNFFRYKVFGSYRSGGIVGAYHWIRCHLWSRYHVINISGQDGYHWGWIDRDHVIFLACFKVLQDFVEKECPTIGLNETIETYYPDEPPPPDFRESIEKQIARRNEIRALYQWWTEDRAKEHAALESLNGQSWLDLLKAVEDKDDEMLLRLMKIRRSLWT